ncbi:glycosyltransferase family 2 protein [Modestobacter sp. VKM Ac-2983]|uniref:glycosyltransferase family 2 protein n=1 Tax=Modestobacter sp. VKM Ac-2983 TaxID=3004137 RepID=UPI0022AB8B2E|nr:glycosyltransferase family 2 protein [Modestobacter sp. VKM Ac-2983]MCZ2803685.1 glycosyltransferase family 2 protein [Modestobacter sp. VKM Ac-2983]
MTAAARAPGRVVTVSVVVVSYESAADLPACLDSIDASASAMVRPQVVVVDNASSDGSAELVESRYPEVRLVRAPGNLGFARAVNLGAAAADGEFVLLLNPDATLRPGALEALVSFALDRPEHGLYGGRVVLPDGTNDPSSCWGEMSLWSLACFATGLSTLLARNRWFDPESLGRWERDSVREVPVITGCLLLVQRAEWEALGGMDETFWLYGEDADLSRSARRKGLRPVVVPEAEIWHTKGASSAGSSKMPLVMAGRATLIRRRWRRPAQALGLALLTAGAALRAAIGRLTGRGAGDWLRVWETRALWRRGYPDARRLVAAGPAADQGSGQ